MDMDVDDILVAHADTLEQQTSEEAVREATEFGTVPGGTYLAAVTKKEWRDAYRPFEGNQKPDRLRVHLQLALRDQVTRDRRGVVFTDVSPIPMRYDNGGQDGPYKLWNQIAGIHQAPQRGLKTGQLFEEIGKYEYLVTVKEQFIEAKKGGDQFHTASSPEQAKQYREAGFKGRNQVIGIRSA